VALAEHELVADWVQVETSATQAYTHAVLAFLLGIALLQGSSGVRKAVLWLMAVVAVLLVGSLAVLGVSEPSAASALALIGILGMLQLVGVFGLLLGEAPGSGRITFSVIAFLVGGLGGSAAEVWLLKAPERWLREQIRTDATFRTFYEDAAAGISVSVPEGWAILEEQSPLVMADAARITLGDRKVGAVAMLFEEDNGGRFMSIDHYLDHLLALRQEGLDTLVELGRSDVQVGKAEGRKMLFRWTSHGRHFEGFSTAWQDGDRIFSFSGWSTRSLATAAQERFAQLEAAVSFEAPIATHLKETIDRVTADCAFLSPKAIEAMIESMPASAPSYLYFRRGYQWASKGVQLGGENPRELGDLMAKVFSSLPPRDRHRLTAYLERIRTGGKSSQQEDAQMNRQMSAAIGKLPQADQDRLRELVAGAILMGRLL
jgi:hypothetical protein